MGRRPPGYGSLSRRRGGEPKISGIPISTYVSSASTRTMGNFLYGQLLCSKIRVVRIKERIGGFLTGKKTNQQLFRAPSFYRVFFFHVFALFPVVSYRNQQFQNRYSSCLVEPDIELSDE